MARPLPELPTPEHLAEVAGLRHLGDDRPGISRRRRGKGWSFTGPRGGTVSPAARRRIAQLAIPPAWTDVWIAPEADAHLQATGIDAAGRKQYLYHPEWRRVADDAKFARLGRLGDLLPALRRRVAHDLASDGSERMVAGVVRLIDEGLLRPGSPQNPDAVGATTLRPEHVDVDGEMVVLRFVGKAEVEHEVAIDDESLVSVIQEVLDDLPASSAALFSNGNGGPISPATVNQYLVDSIGASYSAKDLRTWGATSRAVDHLCAARPASAGQDPNDAAVERAIRETCKAVAGLLGNTPAVCRSSYIAPAVFDAHRSGALAPVWRTSRRSRWLTRAERVAGRVLTST